MYGLMENMFLQKKHKFQLQRMQFIMEHQSLRGLEHIGMEKNLNVFRLDETRKKILGDQVNFYNISLNYSDDEITSAIIDICKKNKIKKSCYIRPFYFVGDYGINLHVTEKAPTSVAIFTFPFGDLFNKNGITAGVVSWRKFSDMSTPPQAKMGGNYLNSIIATQEAKRNGVDEAILLDHNGNVSEAPGENIFHCKKWSIDNTDTVLICIRRNYS